MATIRAIEGCSCPPDRDWFKCRCDAEVTTYDAIGDPWQVEPECGGPWPTPAFVAYVASLHPSARLVFLRLPHLRYVA